jgi:hypothetical protein
VRALVILLLLLMSICEGALILLYCGEFVLSLFVDITPPSDWNHGPLHVLVPLALAFLLFESGEKGGEP